MTPIVADTDEEILQRVATAIHSVSPDAEIILFGSRAEGRARSDSDFDFLVVAETTDRYQLMIQLTRLLEGLKGLASFDLIVIPRKDWERVRQMQGFIGWRADRHGVRIGG